MFKYTDSQGNVRGGKIAFHVFLGLLILTFVFGSFGTIDARERGVKTRLGAVVRDVQPGLYFKTPWIEGVTSMDMRTQSINDTLTAASHDLQDTRLQTVVNYHLDPSAAINVYKQYGNARSFYEQVVNPLIIATVKAVASQYTAAEQIQKRAEMSSAALTALVKAFEGKQVVIEKADIVDVKFSDSFTHAIEAKVTAEQQALQAKNNLDKVKYEAEQRVTQAKAEAEAIRIQAEAITQQGGANYVQLKAVEKWNGVLPAQMIPGSAVPFISVNGVK